MKRAATRSEVMAAVGGDAEEQHEHRSHQCSAADARQPDEESDDGAAENEVEIEVHGSKVDKN
jgi:hypothetical protein